MKETEIRPRELFDRYLELSRRDITRFFSDHARFVAVPCPGCAEHRSTLAFTKLGFDYRLCSACNSLFQSPRPTEDMQDEYSRNSEAVKFWGTHFYKETLAARREKMFRPRAELVAKLVKNSPGVGLESLVDIGAGYGIFLEELRSLGVFSEVSGVEPAPNLAEICRRKGFRIVPKTVEMVGDGELQANTAVAFEVIEHVFDPQRFLEGVKRILRPGGLFLFTTLTISGFDLQVLWQNSKSIYPPHHINLLSTEGLSLLVQRSGLELVELSTPGKLDVDIVANALAESPDIKLPHFVRYLLEHRGPDVREAFQDFLQAACLSSHVRLLVRRPT